MYNSFDAIHVYYKSRTKTNFFSFSLNDKSCSALVEKAHIFWINKFLIKSHNILKMI